VSSLQTSSSENRTLPIAHAPAGGREGRDFSDGQNVQPKAPTHETLGDRFGGIAMDKMSKAHPPTKPLAKNWAGIWGGKIYHPKNLRSFKRAEWTKCPSCTQAKNKLTHNLTRYTLSIRY